MGQSDLKDNWSKHAEWVRNIWNLTSSDPGRPWQPEAQILYPMVRHLCFTLHQFLTVFHSVFHWLFKSLLHSRFFYVARTRSRAVRSTLRPMVGGAHSVARSMREEKTICQELSTHMCIRPPPPSPSSLQGVQGNHDRGRLEVL